MTSTPLSRAMRTLETIPGVVIEPVVFHGTPAFQMRLTDEARALLSEMVGCRPLHLEQVIHGRVINALPLFTHRVMPLTPDQEGN